jgi:nucleoside 2-deoxyribosyltransferase
MKVYIASSFSLIPKIEMVAAILETYEIEITVKWWKRIQLKMEFAKLSPEEFYAHPECKFAFERDYMGIQEADAVVLVADETPRRYNGANVEVGIAYALGKPVFSFGALENSAMYYKVKRCDNTDILLGELRKLAKDKCTFFPPCGNSCASLVNFCNDCSVILNRYDEERLNRWNPKKNVVQEGCASEKKTATFESLNVNNEKEMRDMIDADKQLYSHYSISQLEEAYKNAQEDIQISALYELLQERKTDKLPRRPSSDVMHRRFTI